MAQAYTEENCGQYTHSYLGYTGVIHCQYSDAYEKNFFHDHWKVNILAVEGNTYTPDILVDQARDAISIHWLTLASP